MNNIIPIKKIKWVENYFEKFGVFINENECYAACNNLEKDNKYEHTMVILPNYLSNSKTEIETLYPIWKKDLGEQGLLIDYEFVDYDKDNNLYNFEMFIYNLSND